MTISSTFLTCTPLTSPKPSHSFNNRTNERFRVKAGVNIPNHPVFREFKPLPFIPYVTSNPHFQTIWPFYYPKPPSFKYKRILLNTDDGQAVLKVDLANGNSLAPDSSPLPKQPITVPRHTPATEYTHLPRSPPVVVVLHGLESSSSSVVTKRIVVACTNQKFKTFVLNYRSCAPPHDPPSTLRLYHAGFTEDLETLLRAIKQSAIAIGCHPPDVYLCGFSLGANIVCQFLGRQKEDASKIYHVVGAAGACVPFDPVACQQGLDIGWKGFVYSRHLVRNMQSKFDEAFKAGVDIGDVIPGHVRRADRIGLIDEHFISPVFGFKDRFDYYKKVDARDILKHVKVPTLLINSRDDPFFDHQSGLSLPTDEQIGEAPVMLHLTDHGGHCGFLDKETFRSESSGYFQTEFARFFSSVRQTMSTQARRTVRGETASS